MGVPGLFLYILRIVPRCRRSLDRKSRLTINHLYIDANPWLHTAAQKVHNYGQVKNIFDPYAKMEQTVKELKLLELFFEALKRLTEIITPDKSLYVAIDGPAPLAKQSQQRQRRFVAAKNRKPGKFDSNSISPGTKFMLDVTLYLRTAIRKEANDPNSSWSKIPIHFSPATVPGEGEHKILDYIREQMAIDPSFVNDTHCICGPDGDLLMLALDTHLPKIFLFREDLGAVGAYDFIDMGMVREALVEVLGTSPAVASHIRTVDDASNDFTLLGFFVGNDFLPKIRMFLFLRDGLELMIKTYRNQVSGANREGPSSRYLTFGNQISQDGFATFVETLARDEVQYIFDQISAEYEDPKLRNITLEQHIVSTAEGKMKRLDFPGYRKAYYAKADISDVNDAGVSRGIEKMCIAYLRMIAWVYQYYITGLPSWQNFYAYGYAPLVTDLAKVLRSLKPKEFKKICMFEKDEPLLPFQQLLCILPPPSAELLPKPFRRLMLDANSPIAEVYPMDFTIDYEGQPKEHMGVVVLPFADVDQVKKYYQPIADSLQNVYVRNSVGQPEKFFYDPSYYASYTSRYGDIPNLKVRKVVE